MRGTVYTSHRIASHDTTQRGRTFRTRLSAPGPRGLAASRFRTGPGPKPGGPSGLGVAAQRMAAAPAGRPRFASPLESKARARGRGPGRSRAGVRAGPGCRSRRAAGARAHPSLPQARRARRSAAALWPRWRHLAPPTAGSRRFGRSGRRLNQMVKSNGQIKWSNQMVKIRHLGAATGPRPPARARLRSKTLGFCGLGKSLPSFLQTVLTAAPPRQPARRADGGRGGGGDQSTCAAF